MKTPQLTTYLIVEDECFPPRSGTRQDYLFLTLLFNNVLEVSAKTIRQENEIKHIQIGKEVKTIFTDDMTLVIQKMLCNELK